MVNLFTPHFPGGQAVYLKKKRKKNKVWKFDRSSRNQEMPKNLSPHLYSSIEYGILIGRQDCGFVWSQFRFENLDFTLLWGDKTVSDDKAALPAAASILPPAVGK